MQKKTKKIIMLTILLLIILAIILLIQNTTKQMPQPLTEQAKAEYTTQIGNQTYDITNAVLEPNEITPTISAGMIPIKWNGTNFIITTFDDPNWYDYSIGQPAYIMLNDGYYQSELIQNMQGKELAESSVGNDALVVPNAPNNNPTIYMYIPRFAYNTRGEILHIKQGCSVAGTYTMPEIFTYQTEKRDFSLAGIWVEYTPLSSTSTVNTKINNMQGENNKYGFIANTIGVNANNEPSYKTTVETYNQYIANIVGVGVPDDPSSTEHLNTVGNDALVVPQINDISNPNRTILKITNSKQPEPIKANAYYDETEEKIKIEVTYRTNAITQILDSKGKILSEISTTADTGDEIIGNKTYRFIVIDNIGNIKEIETTVSGLDVYIIENEEDLKLFRDAVNASKTTATTKAYQIADVKMNEGKYTINEETGDIIFASNAEQWNPIGTNSNNAYKGTYDGQGFSISGIYIDTTADYQGLFGYLRGVLKSIKIDESNINADNYVGGVAGYVVGNISNCCNNAQIRGKMYVGGVVGYGEYAKLSCCNNVSKVIGTNSYTGGIAGILRYSGIEESFNFANITGNDYVGGIAGGNQGYNGNMKSINLYNVGLINGNNSLGGIFGTLNSISLLYSYNYGSIYGNSKIGGIVGQTDKSNDVGAPRARIISCYNLGNVCADSTDSGGIVGYAIRYTEVKTCYNSGDVNAKNNKGGIAGTAHNAPSSNSALQVILSGNGYSTIGVGGIGYSNVTNGYKYYGTTKLTQDQMPTVLSVINSNNAFIEDTEGINNGYPLLAWQVETEQE